MKSSGTVRSFHNFFIYIGILMVLGAVNWFVQTRFVAPANRTSPAVRIAQKVLNPARLSTYLAVEKVVVHPGTVIGDYLGRYGIAPQEMPLLLETVRPVYDLARIKAGNFFEFALSRERLLTSFKYHIDEDSFLEVHKRDGRWAAERKEYPFTWKDELVEGTIRDNLFNEIERIGEKPGLAVNLAELFAWDIDFYADLQEGDTFRILFHKKYLDGQPAGYGPILAAEFVNQGQAYKAIRFVFPDGRGEYYTPAGEAVRKELLKSPLKMGTITSRFSHRRKHPTLKVYRPHLGVDIAAPIGTPVHAAGEGTVTFAGYRGQAGRMVEVRHPNNYLTQYLHLYRFASGIRPGSRVSQGQVIAYVGSSGESTGPHLDYRIKLRNAYVNPMKQQFERARPLPDDYLPQFQKLAMSRLRVLDAPGESLRRHYLSQLPPGDNPKPQPLQP
jgi:murein DD-endopeptidase MepM/ murein hydrolase activator NlpD